MNRYANATELLRSTAKWYIGAFAGLGAALIAGIPFSRLGASELPWIWTTVASLGLIIALGAVYFMIHATAKFLLAGWLSLSSFDEDWLQAQIASAQQRELTTPDKHVSAIVDHLDEYAEDLFGQVASSRGELFQRIREVDERSRDLLSSKDISDEALARAFQVVQEVHSASEAGVDYANYLHNRILFRELQKRLSWLLAATLVGTLLFVLAVNSGPSPVQRIQVVSPEAVSTGADASD